MNDFAHALVFDLLLVQIFEEVEIAERRYGKLNTIVMNAVMEACVHCGDVDAALKIFAEMLKPESCGVDSVTYGTLLKVWRVIVNVYIFSLVTWLNALL